MAITARALNRSEWKIFRDIRLMALQTEPGVFTATYEVWAAKTPEEWQRLIEGPGKQVFGLFDNDRLIGITGVFTSQEDTTGKTAVLVMSFILPEYRRRGLSKMLYEVRLQWIRKQPQFSRVIVSHRESNEASRKANQRFGFRLMKREPRTWPDGRIEDDLSYELQICQDAFD